jgi:hypothetical protein
MSDKPINKTIKTRMDDIDNALNLYESQIGLPANTPPGSTEELQSYLDMSRESLDKLAATDCSTIAYRLTRFALYLQRLYNLEVARNTWANTVLNQLAANKLSDYDKFYKHEMKIALMAKEDESIQKLLDIIRYATQRMNRLEEISNNLKYLSNVLFNLQRAKITEYQNQ